MRWMLAVIAVLSLGCAAATPEGGPAVEDAKSAWIDALSSGEPERVWRMLGDGTRSRWPDRAAFDAWCRKRCPEQLVHAVSTLGPGVETHHFDRGLTLVKTDRGWRVRDEAHAGAATVRQALLNLRERGAIALSAGVISALDAALEAPSTAISVQGARARVSLSDGRVITLKKDAGGWRVDGWN